MALTAKNTLRFKAQHGIDSMAVIPPWLSRKEILVVAKISRERGVDFSEAVLIALKTEEIQISLPQRKKRPTR